jgi:hypothetical protein
VLALAQQAATDHLTMPQQVERRDVHGGVSGRFK